MMLPLAVNRKAVTYVEIALCDDLQDHLEIMENCRADVITEQSLEYRYIRLITTPMTL